jgi:hypothetical protein
MAVMEAAAAATGSQTAGLQDKVDSMARELTVLRSQVDGEMPDLKRVLEELRVSVAQAASDPTSWPSAQARLRHLINTTVLPDMVDRHVADMRRLAQQLERLSARAASVQQLEQLRADIEQCRAAKTESTGAHIADTTADTSDAPQAGSKAQLDTADCRLDHVHNTFTAIPKDAAADMHALDIRVRALERLLPPTAVQPDAPAQTGSNVAPQDLEGRLSELQLVVHELKAQQPLMARSYEVDGLRQAVMDAQLKAQRATAVPGDAAPHLHISLVYEGCVSSDNAGDGSAPCPSIVPTSEVQGDEHVDATDSQVTALMEDGNSDTAAVSGVAAAAPEVPADGAQPASSGSSRPNVVTVRAAMHDKGPLALDLHELLRQNCVWQSRVSGALSQQMARLQSDCNLAASRSQAVEAQWVAAAAKWQQGVALLQEALPRMELLTSTTQTNADAILAASQHLVQAPQLNSLLQGCAIIQQLQAQVQAIQGEQMFGSLDSFLIAECPGCVET